MAENCENCKLKQELECLKEENKKLKEENRQIKEELQTLRLELFGIKPARKERKNSDKNAQHNESKKPGPPFGHEGASRKRPEKVDKTVVLKFESCPNCGRKVSELKASRVRYIEDIVPASLFATEYIIKQGYCSSCNKVVYPEVPEAVGNRRFGINFLLYLTYLRHALNLPYNKIAKLLNDTYRANVSEAAVVSYIELTAEIFGQEYERIKREMQNQRYCHYDDTGQRVNGSNLWLWVFINRGAVLYHTSKNRGKKVAIEVLGEDYTGVTVNDFYPSYDKAPGKKQKCWAHLIKDTRKIAGREEPPPRAEKFYKELRRIFHDAKKALERLRTEDERKEAYSIFVKRLKAIAKKDYNDIDVNRLAKRALKYRHELFTFILEPDVEPTNNPAERALRPCVVQRKISGCYRTLKGAENRDIIMSVMGTMHQQGQDFFEAGREYILNTLT